VSHQYLCSLYYQGHVENGRYTVNSLKKLFWTLWKNLIGLALQLILFLLSVFCCNLLLY